MLSYVIEYEGVDGLPNLISTTKYLNKGDTFARIYFGVIDV